MINLISRKYLYLYFLVSVLVIVPGLISLFLFGLKLSIDFTGGSRFTFSVPSGTEQKSVDTIKNVFSQEKIEIGTIQKSKNNILVRVKPIDQKIHSQLISNLKQKDNSIKEENYETIGPTISNEITVNAFKSVVLACLLIVLYIAWSFRKVPKPASSWRFAICTIVALIHDILVVVGVFSLLGHFLGVEVDSLFVTAVLTVVGFSVHDTIVVFDRIRENLRRVAYPDFTTAVNESIVQTLGRSLKTSLTVLLVLFTLLLFGGETLKWFIVALLVGITSGTYSSIFNAAPLLVVWEEWRRKRNKLGS